MLDDTVDVKQPLSVLPKDTVDSWYKDESALITAYVESEHSDAALGSIRAIIGEHQSMAGDSVQIKMTRESVVQDLGKIVLLIVPVIFLILILTTTSYFEPVLFLVMIGVAIMIARVPT